MNAGLSITEIKGALPEFFTYLSQKEELYHVYQDSGWSIVEYKEAVGYLHKQDEFGRQISEYLDFCFRKK